MKYPLFLGCFFVFIGGCSFFVEPPPVPKQQLDLADEDNDGVINARDLCENTPSNSVIDNDGCLVYLSSDDIDSVQIQFEPTSFIVEPSYDSALDKLASFLTQFPDAYIELQGHISSSHPTLSNTTLTEQRVNAVENQLIYRGAPANQVVINTLAENNLKISENSSSSQFINSRVIARLKGIEGKRQEKWTIFTRRKK